MKTALRLLLAPYRFSVDRLFRMGEIGGAHWFTDPNLLYRRRNRLMYTRDFSNAAWTKTNILSTTSDADGVGDLVVPNTTNATHNVSQAGVAYSAGNVMRVRAKAGGYNFIAIRIGLDAYAHFNVSAGTVGTLSGATGAIAAAADAPGYYDCTCVTTSAVAGANALIYVAAVDGVLTFAGDGTSGVYLARAQLETYTTTATEYQDVPTTWPEAYLAAVGAENIFAWTDNAGTTPVTAVGDTIGLSLDRAYGGARGPELVTNGDFSNGTTGWNDSNVTASGGTAAVVGGAAVITRGSARAEYYQTINTVIGKTYGFYGTVTAKSATANWWLGTTRNNASNLNLTGVVVGTSRGIFTATATTTFVTMAVDGSAGQTVTIDNISIREIPGTHLIQATGTARPTLSARVNLLLNTATMSTQNVTTIAASYRLRFDGTGTVTLSGTATAGPLSAGTHSVTATAGTLTLTVSGSVTSADFRTADDAAKNLPAYQRVGATAADHDTDGFPHGQYPDGTDDNQTTTTGGGGTTGFFYCGAITVSGGAGTARTIWSDTGTNTGYRVRINSSNKLELAAGNGSAYTTVASNETITAPGTYILSAWDDGGVLAVQVNNFAAATTTRPSVSAGTSTATMYKDNGAASSYLNGRDYGSVYRQSYIGESQHARLKRWLADRARITL